MAPAVRPSRSRTARWVPAGWTRRWVHAACTMAPVRLVTSKVAPAAASRVKSMRGVAGGRVSGRHGRRLEALSGEVVHAPRWSQRPGRGSGGPSGSWSCSTSRRRCRCRTDRRGRPVWVVLRGARVPTWTLSPPRCSKLAMTMSSAGPLAVVGLLQGRRYQGQVAVTWLLRKSASSGDLFGGGRRGRRTDHRLVVPLDAVEEVAHHLSADVGAVSGMRHVDAVDGHVVDGVVRDTCATKSTVPSAGVWPTKVPLSRAVPVLDHRERPAGPRCRRVGTRPCRRKRRCSQRCARTLPRRRPNRSTRRVSESGRRRGRCRCAHAAVGFAAVHGHGEHGSPAEQRFRGRSRRAARSEVGPAGARPDLEASQRPVVR